MVPAIPSARKTRSSTRSQIQKPDQDQYLNTSPLTAKDTGKVIKKRKSSATKAKKTKKTDKSGSKASKIDVSTTPDKSEDISAKTPFATTFSIDSDLVNKPIICHKYTPTAQKLPAKSPSHFIFTHGAGGTLSASAVVNFCTGFASSSATQLLAFQGSSNLGARAKGFHACHDYLGSEAKDIVFGGRSLGARAAVVAATEKAAKSKGGRNTMPKLVLVSYPLQGPKDVRDQILLDLPADAEVLFIVGNKDTMCPLDLLEKVREGMKAGSRLVVVRGADHGMGVRPASRTGEVGEETGRVTSRWLAGDIESDGETLYVGEEE